MATNVRRFSWGIASLETDQSYSRAEYKFSLPMDKDGAVLILPEGAQSHDVQEEKRFLDEAIQHGVDWHKFATETAYRIINDNSLYLITGFHKAHSWSLGVARSGQSLFSSYRQRFITFRVGQIHEGGITAKAYSWDFAPDFEGRPGPENPYRFCGKKIPNQTVFIRGFRITVNETLSSNKVSVKIQDTALRKEFGSWSHDLASSGIAESSSSSTTLGGTDNAKDQDHPGNRAQLTTDAHVTIDRIPDVFQVRLSVTLIAIHHAS